MTVQQAISGLVVLAAAAWLAGCTGTSITTPPGPGGVSGGGVPGGVPGGTGSGSSSGSSSGTGAGDDPGAVFDKSLGDFDGDIGREREEMAKTGQGSGRAAEKQESSDTDSVRTAGRGDSPEVGGSSSESGSAGGFPGGIGGVGGVGGDQGRNPTKDGGATSGAGSGPDSGVGPEGEARGEDGSGTPSPDAAAGGEEGAGASGLGGTGGSTVELPADIPANGAGEDQVAKQLRDAAMAEKDPAIREALWNEYRKVMGIRKK